MPTGAVPHGHIGVPHRCGQPVHLDRGREQPQRVGGYVLPRVFVPRCRF